MADIKENILKLSEKLKKEMKVGEGGVIEVPKDILSIALEGTNISESDVKEVQKVTADVFAASMNAVGELAVAAMKKNKKLDQVSVEIPVLKDTISHVVQRQKEVIAGMPKDGQEREMKTVYGFVSSKYVNDVSGSKGEAKKVRAHIAALAEEAFG